MRPRKTRWSKVYESSEEELVLFLRARNVTATRWAVEEFEQLSERKLDVSTDIYLAEGSASFTAHGQTYSMQPGDALQLPGDIVLGVTAGMSGCVCYESTPGLISKK